MFYSRYLDYHYNSGDLTTTLFNLTERFCSFRNDGIFRIEYTSYILHHGALIKKELSSILFIQYLNDKNFKSSKLFFLQGKNLQILFALPNCY